MANVIAIGELASLKPTTSNVESVRGALASGAVASGEISAFSEWLNWAESDGVRAVLQLGALKHAQQLGPFQSGVRELMRCGEALRGRFPLQARRGQRTQLVDGIVASDDQRALVAMAPIRDSLYGSVKACALFPPPRGDEVRSLDPRRYVKTAVKFYRRDYVSQGMTRHGVRVEENPFVEIALLRVLNHANIVGLIDCFYTPKYLVAAFDFIDNGELFDLVANNGPRQIPEARRMFRIMAEVMQFCHRNGIAHRDISLENYMVTRDMQPILIDFGLAYVMALDEEANGGRGAWRNIPHTGRVGKLVYFAPEMYNVDHFHTSYSGEAVDTWCLGVSLFVLIVGAPPWDVPGVTDDRFERIVNGRDLAGLLAEWNVSIPESSIRLMQNILHGDWTQRPSLDDILASDFIAIGS